MDLAQLRCFVKVAEYQHMTRAAQVLSLSQPALSKTIRLLEEEFGTALFERRGKHIALTESGRVLLRRSRGLLDQAESLREEVRASGGAERAPVRLAVRGVASLLPGLLSAFHAVHPGVRFDIRQNDDLVVQNQQYDLMIGTSFLPRADEHTALLLQEEVLALLPKEHPLAGREELSLEELTACPLIGLAGNRIVSPLLHACFEDAGLTPRSFAECDDGLTIRNLVAAGLGLALLPRYSLSPADRRGLVQVPVTGGLRRYVVLTWKPDAYLSPSVRLFRSHTVRYFEELGEKSGKRP